MIYFTKEEFLKKYNDCSFDIHEWQIDASCEMIFSQIGLNYRNSKWNKDTVPFPIKDACMEQLRFMLDYDIPFVDYKDKVKAGSMEASLNSDYSTLALRKLANNGYLYRGSRMNDNMGINVMFGGDC